MMVVVLMMMIACSQVHVPCVKFKQAMPPRTIIGGHFAAQAAKTDFQVVQKWTLMHDLFSPRGSTIQGGIDTTAKEAKKEDRTRTSTTQPLGPETFQAN